MFRIDPIPSGELATSLSAARSDLWLPRAALSSCVRAVISRDTRGVSLDEPARYNHFPASPVCSLLWYFSGEAEVLEAHHPAAPDSPCRPLPHRISFCGPFNRPVISRNPGPMHAMMLLLLPDALAQLTGIDPGAFLNRMVPAEEVLDASWMAMCRAVDAAPDDEARLTLIEAFLHPLWQEARPDATSPVRVFSDWSQSLAMRASTSGWGRSLRQVERRIKQWTGQPLRELRGLGRSEQAFFDAVLAGRSGEVNWSDVASSSGYADQSHLSRQTRRITGFPPAELRRRIFADESFWAYRLWGFSESQLPD
ncbi:MAG: helix-turn-helix transcriptional regulator [Zoogloea sp.]|nr:helix-turn-helix transcriptional regulator [Zoogloea sp.]